MEHAQRAPLYIRCPQCGYINKGIDVGVSEQPDLATVTLRCEECGWMSAGEMSAIEVVDAVKVTCDNVEDADAEATSLETLLLQSGVSAPSMTVQPLQPLTGVGGVLAQPAGPPPAAAQTPLVRRLSTASALRPKPRRSRWEAWVLTLSALAAVATGTTELVLLYPDLSVPSFVLLLTLVLPTALGLFAHGLWRLWRDTRR